MMRSQLGLFFLFVALVLATLTFAGSASAGWTWDESPSGWTWDE
jgi:hypothetical protein